MPLLYLFNVWVDPAADEHKDMKEGGTASLALFQGHLHIISCL